MSVIDINLVERFTGQRRIFTVEAALNELNQANAAYNRAHSNYRRASTALLRGKLGRWYANARTSLATLPQRRRIPGWVVFLVLCSLISISLATSVVLVCDARLSVILAIGLAPYLGFGLLPVIFPEDTAALVEAAHQSVRKMEVIRTDRTLTQAMLRESANRRAKSKALYDGMVKARDFPLNRLLSADFRLMSGPDFEEFLAKVFAFLGYSVRRTGRAGDQGVDLVIGLNGLTIAVQAKCYSHPVGNSAIQEVYAGMQFYACHRCVVVTTSSFTQGGRALATAVRCTLISGDQIHGLIRGQINVH